MKSIRRAGLAALVVLGVSSGAPAATLDLTGGVLSYTATAVVVNQLTVSLGAGIYLIDDPGESSIAISAVAGAAGCANLDANTVSCPRAAISSWNVQLVDQNDTANLGQVLEPITFRGGQGADSLTAGANADTFLWAPGDSNDALDGGPGADALSFTAANIAEMIGVSAIVGGFQVTRDVAAVSLQAFNVESLSISALGGDDIVSTVPLSVASQSFDGGVQTVGDTLNYDAHGVCTTAGAASFQTLGAQPVTLTGFETVNLLNQCTVFPAALDISAGALSYVAGSGAANNISVSLAAGTYTIGDSGVPAITLGTGAVGAGCANLNAVTVACPRSAIASWSLQLVDQSDTANLGQVLDPITFRGGQGDDMLNGGPSADTFLWAPGDANDRIDGGLGADALSFTTANIAEILTVSALPGGSFRITRNVANVILDAFNVESLTLQALGGDDSVSTIPLAATRQILDGGGQSVADTLSYNALGLCTVHAPGWFESGANQPIGFTGFETVSITNECAKPIPLSLSLRVIVATLLGISAIVLARRRPA